ncbi:cell adhesion molecule Dscam1-like isoform X10 [Tachypleus tridentatus]|uniref:cell adhesion molecule Dscam1-like isoform X10 n=1 Tax=Tachypleus tridentatus TaxID=6853 RepID=UPI003FD213A0
MASNMKRILRYVIVEVLLTVLQLATLSEGGVPKLHSFGFPEKVDLGGRVQMVCNLNKGSVPVSFSWSKDDRPILDGKHIEIGSWNDMSSYLMIHSIYAEDIGNYTCLATNRIGTDSFTANLVVSASDPPKIQPFVFPDNLEIGTQTRVTCGLQKGSLPVRFTWKKNGAALNPVPDKIRFLKDDGFVMLEIKHLDVGDVANYTCSVRNREGEDSFTSRLVVTELPVLHPIHVPKDVEINGTVQVFCNLKKGSLPVEFSWTKDGRHLLREPEIETSTLNERASLLVIKHVTTNDVGNYTCHVENLAGSAKTTASLVFRAPPFWKEQPKDSEAVLGKTTSLHCGIGGYPKPVITWKKAYGTQSKDFLIIRSDYKKKTILDNGTLVISMVEGADEGVYTCGAENGVGEGIQATVRLSVHAPPIVTSIQMRSSAKRGETAVIECEISGEQPFLVSWAKDGTKLTMPSTRYESYEEASGKGVKATLLVSSVERGDQGNYVCNVKNDYGSGKDVTILAVQEPPESPLDVRVVSKNSRSARVTWGSPSSVSAPIKQFVMMYWKNSKVSGKLHEVMLSSTETSTLLRDLQPGSEYTVRLLAENEVGRGDPSDPVTFETKEEEPEAPPVDIEVEPVDSHTLQISWKPPPTDTWNGQLKGYHVGYKVEGLASQLSYETVIKTNLREEKTLLRNLLPSTRYSVSVNAFNNAGDGPPSEELVTSTLNGDPPQPPEVKVKNVSQTSVTVMWSPRIDTQGSVRQYVLEYEDSSQNKNELHAPGTIKEYCIEGLEPGQRYGVRVAAYNRFGRGDFSPSLVVITEGNARVPGYEPVILETPFYFRLYFVVPVVASVTVILCVIILAWACLKKTHYNEGRKAQLYVSYQQRLTYVPPSEVSRDSRAGDAAYDVPWDFSNGGGTMIT